MVPVDTELCIFWFSIDNECDEYAELLFNVSLFVKEITEWMMKSDWGNERGLDFRVI